MTNKPLIRKPKYKQQSQNLMYNQRSQKILLEKLHLKNKAQYHSKNNLELYKENKNINTLVNHLSHGSTNATSEKPIANLITENFAQASSTKTYSTQFKSI